MLEVVDALAPRHSGPERVAAVLLGLEEDTARRLLKHFAQDDLRAIARAAAKLGSVSSERIEPLFAELIETLASASIDVTGDPAKAEKLLMGVVEPDAVVDIMSEVTGRSNQAFWRRLSRAPHEQLGAYLSKERAQTAALILANIENAVAARALESMSPQARNATIRRMLTLRPASDAALRLLEKALAEEFLVEASSGVADRRNMRVAGIINQMERDKMEDLLKSIDASEPKLTAKLKRYLFSFEDLPKLDARARSILFDQAATDQVILALHGAGAPIREAVLPTLSARTRRMAEAELATTNPPPRAEILRAQRAIADLVLQLAAQRVIDLAGEDRDAA